MFYLPNWSGKTGLTDMMKTFFLLLVLFVVVSAGIFSCQQKSEATQDAQQKSNLVFQADSLLFNSMETDSSLSFLTAAQVKELAGDFFEEDTVNDYKWILADFYKIDSLKKVKKYDDYVQHLDIGMTKDSDVRQLKEVTLEDGSVFKIWTVRHTSYEACPFMSGNEIFATLVYDGKVKDCFLVGREMNASDPPVWMTLNTYGGIYSDGTVKVSSKERSCEGETDKNNAEIVLSKSEEVSFVIRQGNTTNLVTKTWDN